MKKLSGSLWDAGCCMWCGFDEDVCCLATVVWCGTVLSRCGGGQPGLGLSTLDSCTDLHIKHSDNAEPGGKTMC
jgi:hypothetical protein